MFFVLARPGRCTRAALKTCRRFHRCGACSAPGVAHTGSRRAGILGRNPTPPSEQAAPGTSLRAQDAVTAYAQAGQGPTPTRQPCRACAM